MTTTTAKKANRGHLLRAAKKGQLFLRCSGRYTDDYHFDAATNFGKAENFDQVYIEPDYDSSLFYHLERDERDEVYREFQSAVREMAAGRIIMTERDFKTSSGHVWGTTEAGSFSVHSNLSYDYEIRK